MRISFFVRKSCALLLPALFLTAGMQPAMAESTSSAEAAAAAAEQLLDSWQGQRSILIEGGKRIAEALTLDPKSPHALVERGRLLIMAGSPDEETAFKAAEQSFLAAQASDPNYARAPILLGYAYVQLGRFPEAKQALERADALKSNDPWLKLNWAGYYAALNDHESEIKYANLAIASGTKNAKALNQAYSIQADYYSNYRPDRKKADEAYHQKVQLQPGNVYARGDYARILVMRFGDLDAGEALAKEAQAMSDYPHLRQTISLARYARWAEAQKAGKDPALVAALWKKADAGDPGGRYIPTCGLDSPVMKTLMAALKQKAMQAATYQC